MMCVTYCICIIVDVVVWEETGGEGRSVVVYVHMIIFFSLCMMCLVLVSGFILKPKWCQKENVNLFNDST